MEYRDWWSSIEGVTHKMVDGWQLSVQSSIHERFCEVMIYSWRTYTTLIRREVFFTEKYEGHAEAVQAAKIWAENYIGRRGQNHGD